MFSLTTILGFFSGLWKVVLKVLEQLKLTEAINTGKELQNAEIAKTEIEVNRQQTEILTEDRSREDTIKKMEDGTY